MANDIISVIGCILSNGHFLISCDMYKSLPFVLQISRFVHWEFCRSRDLEIIKCRMETETSLFRQNQQLKLEKKNN